MKMKKKIRIRHILIVMFSLGLLISVGNLIYIFAVPAIASRGYDKETQDLKAAFLEQVAASENLEELYQEMADRNEKEYMEQQPRIYITPKTDPEIDLLQYGLEDSITGFISIPKMNIELPIRLTEDYDTDLNRGAILFQHTSYPIGGANTNTVIMAHRNCPYGVMFRDIEKLELGDEVIVQNFRETLTYRVSGFYIMKDTHHFESLLIQDGKELLTLCTCHPFGETSQRYVVYCQRVEDGGESQ